MENLHLLFCLLNFSLFFFGPSFLRRRVQPVGMLRKKMSCQCFRAGCMQRRTALVPWETAGGLQNPGFQNPEKIRRSAIQKFRIPGFGMREQRDVVFAVDEH
jgi:hypothetical protein